VKFGCVLISLCRCAHSRPDMYNGFQASNFSGLLLGASNFTLAFSNAGEIGGALSGVARGGLRNSASGNGRISRASG